MTLAEKHDDSEYIFVKYITGKDGRRIYAKDYNKKAFRILIRKRK